MNAGELSFATSRLAELAEAHHDGPDIAISGAAGLEDAGDKTLAFVRAGSDYAAALQSKAAALCVPEDFPSSPDRTLIRHANPRWVFALALRLLSPPDPMPAGVHPTAVVAEDVVLGEDVRIGPLAVLESGVRVGDGCRVGAQCYLAADVVLGDQCRLDPRVVVYSRSRIGRGVRILAGAVIGSDGFGFEAHEGHVLRLEHIGGVEIADGAEIGANTCVDRGTTGTTRIGPSVKIDNLVQIGHNCDIGAGSLIAGQSGIAGSSRLGTGVILGGATGVRDHAVIGDGAMVGGRSGIAQDVPPGARVSGTPARDHRDALRESLALGRLPDLLRAFARLQARVETLEAERDA